jgi:hypothetical protein
MVDERRFYTYAYLRKDGTPYYIGKGQGNRAFNKQGHRLNLPPRERILFLKIDLTEQEAFRHEVYMIAVLGRKDLGTGILRNLTDGGEGPSGVARNEETRAKMRKSAKIRQLGAQKDIELTRIFDGKVFIFGCVNDAARALNLDRGNLSKVCLGRQDTIGGYMARYQAPGVTEWGKGLLYKIEEVEKKKEGRAKKAGKANKLKTQKTIELTQISDGSVLVFDSLHDAARSLDLNFRNLSLVCLGKRKTHKGFTARYL